MLKRRFVIQFLIVVALLVSGLNALNRPTEAQTTASADAVLDVVARINDYRLQNGRNPLVISPTLQSLGQFQVDYLLTLPSLPEGSALHIGSTGEQPGQRAVRAPFNWPTYGLPQQISIGENAGIGGVKFVMDFWKGSTTHEKTMLSVEYREIGVGVGPHRFGYIFIVVFGGRPNVLPVSVNPLTNELYLPTESYTKGQLPRIQNVRTVQFLDSNQNPLGDPVPYQRVMPIPPNLPNQIILRFDDGKIQVTTQVNLRLDLAVLTSTLDLVKAQRNNPDANATQVVAQPTVVATSTSAAPTAQPTVTPFPTSTPRATATSQATALPTSTQRPGATTVPSNTPIAVSSATPTALPQNTATATLAASPAAVDVLIVYDTLALSVINATSGRIDISRLVLRGSGRTLQISQMGQFSPFSMSDFPSGYCVQAAATTSAPTVPSGCRQRASYINIASDRRFWLQADFTVEQDGQVLATCVLNAGTCSVDLP